MSDPTRWSKDPLARPPAADILLRSARRPRSPGTDELARLESVVSQIPRRAALSARRRSRLVVAAAAAAVVASLGTAVWALRARRPSGASASTVVLAAVKPTPALAPRPPVPAQVPAGLPAPRSPVRRHTVTPPDVSAAVQRERTAPPAVATVSADSLALEIGLIDAARADVNPTPARALASLEAHRRQFPHGQLAAEREFLAVEALRGLGRLDEARWRAAELQINYPSSSYAARAVRLLRSP